MKFEIKHQLTGATIFKGDYVSMRACVEAAVEARADLADADLGRANLAGADLTDADLTGADLTGAYLAGADLTDADLTGADLTRAYLAGADLTGVDLTGADLADADLGRANLAGANLAGADLAGADLTGAYLAGADLAGADLTGADLAGANLAGVDLTGADLTGADLAGANLTGADLTGALNVPQNDTSAAQPGDRKPRAQRLAERAARYREAHPDVPVIEALDAKILAALDSGAGKLDMSDWHICQTTHCRAGWAITLAGERGKALEAEYGSESAGAMIYRASTGRVPYFYDTTDRALQDIRTQAALQTGGES